MNSLRKLALTAVALVAAFALLACGGGDKDSAENSGDAAQTSTDSAASQTTAASDAKQPAALPADPLEAVVQALKNQQTAGPYRIKTTVSTESGEMEMTGEIIPPDKMHMVSNIGDQKQEMVFIGDKGWMNMGGSWTEAPIKASDIMAQMSSGMVDEFATTTSDVKAVGTETVDGQEAMVYSYVLDMNKSTSMKLDVVSSVKLWVSTASGLPIKQQIEGEAMNVKSTSTQLIEYDPSITIEAPVME